MGVHAASHTPRLVCGVHAACRRSRVCQVLSNRCCEASRCAAPAASSREPSACFHSSVPGDTRPSAPLTLERASRLLTWECGPRVGAAALAHRALAEVTARMFRARVRQGPLGRTEGCGWCPRECTQHCPWHRCPSGPVGSRSAGSLPRLALSRAGPWGAGSPGRGFPGTRVPRDEGCSALLCRACWEERALQELRGGPRAGCSDGRASWWPGFASQPSRRRLASPSPAHARGL